MSNSGEDTFEYASDIVDAINASGTWTATFIGTETAIGALHGLAIPMKDLSTPPDGAGELQIALRPAQLSAGFATISTWESSALILSVGSKDPLPAQETINPPHDVTNGKPK